MSAFGKTFGGAFGGLATPPHLGVGGVRQLLFPPLWLSDGKLDPRGWINTRSSALMVKDYEGSRVAIDGGLLVMVGARYVDIGGGDYEICNTDSGGDDLPTERKYQSIVIIGDSLVAGSEGHDYLPTIMDCAVVDAGIGGDRLDEMDTRFAADVVALSPSAVFIQGGVNDAIQDRTFAQMQTSLLSIVAKAVAANINIVIGNISVWEGYTVWSEARQTVADAFNAWLITYASSNDYPLLDIYSLLEDPANPRALNPIYDSSDGLHPNIPGDCIIAWGYADLLNFDRVISWKQSPASSNLLPVYVANLASDPNYAADDTAYTPTGMSLGGGDAASTTIVATANADYPGGRVYKVVNAAAPGTGFSYVSIGPNVNESDLHTCSVIIKTEGGRAWVKVSSNTFTQDVAANDYTRFKSPSFIPSSDRFRIYMSSGVTVWFILPQYEAKAKATPPIINQGSALGRDICDNQHDYSAAVHNQASGFFYIDLTPEQAQSALSASDEGIITLSESIANLIYVDDGNLQSTDGTNTAAVDPNYAADTKIRFLVYWDTKLDVLGLGWRLLHAGSFTWAAEQSYSGETPSASLIHILLGNSQIWQIHDLGGYNKHQSQSYYDAKF